MMPIMHENSTPGPRIILNGRVKGASDRES